jgi:hypothetical protein
MVIPIWESSNRLLDAAGSTSSGTSGTRWPHNASCARCGHSTMVGYTQQMGTSTLHGRVRDFARGWRYWQGARTTMGTTGAGWRRHWRDCCSSQWRGGVGRGSSSPPMGRQRRKRGGETTTAARRCDVALPDVKDLLANGWGNIVRYSRLHEEACHSWRDACANPATRYRVFARCAHEGRGRCCGSGCHHCLYNHANVRDKAGRMRLPAFPYNSNNEWDSPGGSMGSGEDHNGVATTTPFFVPVSMIVPGSHVKVLSFSGGEGFVPGHSQSHKAMGSTGCPPLSTFLPPSPPHNVLR